MLFRIFVSLKAWADSGLALMPFLTQQFAICTFPNAQPFIEHILAEGQAMVLFDGLDEVNLEQGTRERITREVRDLADQYPRSRCVITCRTAASDYQFERFAYCELADFTEDQMRTFVEGWFRRDEAKRVAFLAEFAKAEHDRLRDLVLAFDLAFALALAHSGHAYQMVAFQTNGIWTGLLLWVQVMASTDPGNSIDTDHDDNTGYDELLEIWHQQSSCTSPELRTALTKLTFPAKEAPIDNWKRFETDLRTTLVAHLDIGHFWTLDTAQLRRLNDYLAASSRMLECLDLAAVADRDAIRNRLLLPPQP